MATIRNAQEYQKVRDALKRGEFADDPEVQDEIISAAEAWVSAQPKLEGFRASEQPRFGLGDFATTLGGVGENALKAATTIPALATAGFQGIARGLAPGGLTAAEGVEQSLAGDIGLGLGATGKGADIPLPSIFQPRTEQGRRIDDLLMSTLEDIAPSIKDFSKAIASHPKLPLDDDAAVATAVETALLGGPAVIGPLRNIGTRTTLNNRQRVLQEAQQEGYVTPTSSAVPESAVRGAVEGITGKPRIQQQASVRNQPTTNRIAAQELGLPEGTEITLSTLDGVRAQAGQAYNVLDAAGTITTGTVFRRDLAAAISNLRRVSRSFPELIKKDGAVSEAINTAQSLMKDTFEASVVTPVTRLLRDEATAAFRNGQASVGNAYRQMSKAIEDAAEAHLVKFGDPDAIAAFRAARERIAKSYSVEEALVGDGFVSAGKLAAQRQARKPLTGGLDLIARFAEQFPNSVKVIKESPIQQGKLSSLLGIAGSAGFLGSGDPLIASIIAASTFGSPAIRAGLLSKPGQRLFANPARTETTGLAPANAGLLLSSELAQQ